MSKDNEIPMLLAAGTTAKVLRPYLAEVSKDAPVMIRHRDQPSPINWIAPAFAWAQIFDAAEAYDDLRAEVLYLRARLQEIEEANKPKVLLMCDKGGN